MVISHNLQAMNAQRQFNIVTNRKKKTTEKLSSGYKINRAADDAAGLAISEKMRRQIRGLSQGTDNIQDGISFVQVADGALEEVTGMLQRINELSVKAANGTLEAGDRLYIDNEVQQLKSEIDRIYETTTFNDRKIWEEGQVVVNTRLVEEVKNDQYPAVVFNSVNSISSYSDNNNKEAFPRSSINVTASDAGIKVSWTGYNGNTYESELIPLPDDDNLVGTHTFRLSNYMDYSKYPDAAGIDFDYKYTVNEYSTKEEVIRAFNETRSNPSRSVYTSVSNNKEYEDNSKPKILSISATIEYDAMLASGKNQEGDDTQFIEFSSLTNPALDSVDDSLPLIFKFDMPRIGTVTSSVRTGSSTYYSGSYVSDINDRTGENIWWREYTNYYGTKYKSTISYQIDGSLNSILSAINNTDGHSLWTDNDTGGHISIGFDLKSDTPYTRADGVTTNIVGTLSLSFSVRKNVATTQEELVDYITDAIANLKLVDIYDNDSSSNSKEYVRIGMTSNSNSSTKSTHTYSVFHEVHDYTSLGYCDLYIQSGAEAEHGMHITYDNMSIRLLGLESTNTRTSDFAKIAIDDVKEALRKVSSQRSDFGAYQNRLEHAAKSNKNVVENTTAAESRIRDAEMDKEVVRDSILNILSQSGTMVLAQANQSSQTVLSLLNR